MSYGGASIPCQKLCPYVYRLYHSWICEGILFMFTSATLSATVLFFFFFSSRRRHTRLQGDWSSDVCSSDLELGTLLGGAYVNRFNYYDRSYKVIPQIGDERRTTVAPLLDLKIKTPSGRLVPVSTFTHIESSTAPRTLNRFQQRNAVRIFGGVKPGVTKEEGLWVLENAAAAAAGPGVGLDYAGESRQIRLEGAALTVTLGFAVILIYLVLAAQFKSFRDPLIVLVGSVPLAISGALVFSFLDRKSTRLNSSHL